MGPYAGYRKTIQPSWSRYIEYDQTLDSLDTTRLYLYRIYTSVLLLFGFSHAYLSLADD